MNYLSKSLLISCLVFVALFFSNVVAAQEAVAVQETSVTTQTKVRMVIYYSGDIDEEIKSKDNYLMTFLATYNLTVVNTFTKNEFVKGFTVETDEDIKEATFIAKELSMVDEVLMIEVLDSKKDASI